MAKNHLAHAPSIFEFYREIGKDADTLRSHVDHEIDAAALAIEVEIALILENGRHDGKNAAIGREDVMVHSVRYLRWL